MQNKSKSIKNKFVSLVLITFFVFGLFTFNTFEGGTCAGVTWTYNSATNTATATGTGTTNFAELVQADIDGGWGKFTSDVTGTQIICNAKIVIGDRTNECVFTDSLKNVLFTGSTTSTWQNCIWVSKGSTLILGVLDNESSKRVSRGCNLLFNEGRNVKAINNEDNGDVYLYATSISKIGSGGNVVQVSMKKSTDRVWGCKLSNNVYFNSFGGNLYYTSVMYQPNYPTFEGPLATAVFDSLKAESLFQLVKHWDNTFDLVMSNLSARGCTWTAQMENTAHSLYLINPDVDVWNFVWQNSPDALIFRQYTFNLNVLNGEITDFVDNATVQLWKDSVLVYEGVTNSSGMIPTQTLTYGYYQQSTGNAIQNASSPYYLVVTHPEWQTYVSRFYITEPLRLTVSMQEPTVTDYSEVEKSDYTTIILFIISLILCIIGLALTVPLLPLISLTISVLNIIFLSEPSIFNILLIILNVTFTLITLVRVKTKNN